MYEEGKALSFGFVLKKYSMEMFYRTNHDRHYMRSLHACEKKIDYFRQWGHIIYVIAHEKARMHSANGIDYVDELGHWVNMFLMFLQTTLAILFRSECGVLFLS